jgi:site-specific recombinase XerD
MGQRVVLVGDGHRVEGCGADGELVNRFLAHLGLRGPTAGQPMTEAGLRRIFRTHRLASGALRVRPPRLRHTYGTELASAGIDLLALRELMGHANPETTAAYVHLSPETLAAEYARARAAAR